MDSHPACRVDVNSVDVSEKDVPKGRGAARCSLELCDIPSVGELMWLEVLERTGCAKRELVCEFDILVTRPISNVVLGWLFVAVSAIRYPRLDHSVEFRPELTKRRYYSTDKA